MNWRILKTENDYEQAALRLMEVFHAEEDTLEHQEMELLSLLIEDYDARNFKIKEIDPLKIIQFKMKDLGIKAKDLEPIIGSKGHVSSVLSGKREITLKMAQKLIDFFKLPPEVFLHVS